jgi:hypothetical protein
MVKKQQMRWIPRGAHLLLQVRTRYCRSAPASSTTSSPTTSTTGIPASTRRRTLSRSRRSLPHFVPLSDQRAERRRRLAEPDLEFRAFCARKGLPASSTPQLERAWDAWQAERYQRGETGQRPGYADNPFRPR